MLKKIWRWLTGANSKMRNSLIFGKEIANDIKDIADSTLLDVITALTATKLDDIALISFRQFMSDLINRLNWEDKILSETEHREKTIMLHTLSATAALWKAEQEGVNISLQTTLSTAQLIYNKSKVVLDV